MSTSLTSPRTATERITIGLTRRSSQDLADLSESSGMSKTDIVNRALGLYKLMTDKTVDGVKLAFLDPSGKSVEIVHVL